MLRRESGVRPCRPREKGYNLWKGMVTLEIDFFRASCKMRDFVQNQGMREILPQVYG